MKSAYLWYLSWYEISLDGYFTNKQVSYGMFVLYVGKFQYSMFKSINIAYYRKIKINNFWLMWTRIDSRYSNDVWERWTLNQFFFKYLNRVQKNHMWFSEEKHHIETCFILWGIIKAPFQHIFSVKKHENLCRASQPNVIIIW